VQETLSVLVIKTGQLMLYREIIAVCSHIHTKHINTLCGQNVELLNVEFAGTYTNHWAELHSLRPPPPLRLCISGLVHLQYSQQSDVAATGPISTLRQKVWRTCWGCLEEEVQLVSCLSTLSPADATSSSHNHSVLHCSFHTRPEFTQDCVF
jgi:hypothetical protein